MLRYSKRTIVALVCVSAAAFFLVPPVVHAFKTVKPPHFLARQGPPSFAELLAAPPSFIYGSSIAVWIYKEEGAHNEGEPSEAEPNNEDHPRRIVELCVTGH